MTDIELILTMLAEATTTKLHRDRDSHGFNPLKKDAKGVWTKNPIISSKNYKQIGIRKQKTLKSGND